jgi:hypothetical protein
MTIPSSSAEGTQEPGIVRIESEDVTMDQYMDGMLDILLMAVRGRTNDHDNSKASRRDLEWLTAATNDRWVSRYSWSERGRAGTCSDELATPIFEQQ